MNSPEEVTVRFLIDKSNFEAGFRSINSLFKGLNHQLKVTDNVVKQTAKAMEMKLAKAERVASMEAKILERELRKIEIQQRKVSEAGANIHGFLGVKNLDEQTAKTIRFARATDGVTKGIIRAQEGVSKLSVKYNQLIGFFLSIMFISMALNRLVMGFWRSAATTMTKIEGYTGAWTKSTMRLSAAWEFFKFQLLDILAQSPIFQMLIGYIINLVNWLSDWDETSMVLLASSLATIAGLTTLGMVVGQIGTLVSSVGGIFAENGAINLAKIAKSMKKIARIGAITIALAFTVGSLLSFINALKEGNYAKAILAAICTGLGIGATIALAGGGLAAAAVIGVIAISIGLLITWLWWGKDKMRDVVDAQVKSGGYGPGGSATYVPKTNINIPINLSPDLTNFDPSVFSVPTGVAASWVGWNKTLNNMTTEGGGLYNVSDSLTGHSIIPDLEFLSTSVLPQSAASFIINMSISATAVRQLSEEIARIPREVTTIHRLITISEDRV